MATDQYPNRNVNVPMKPSAVNAARARLDPGRTSTPRPISGDNRGSRRQVRPGEWIDDRVIELNRRASPSKDSPPELPGSRATPPSSYDITKVYKVTLGKPAEFSGRILAPGKEYEMVGAAAESIKASIVDAVELGDIPADPESFPS